MTPIEEYIRHGHFFVRTPDGNVDDFDFAIPAYWTAQTTGFSECIDTMGSEADGGVRVDDDDNYIVEFQFHGTEFADGTSWGEAKRFAATCRMAEHDEYDEVLDIFELKEIPPLL